jgi:hypothetical protein
MISAVGVMAHLGLAQSAIWIGIASLFLIPGNPGNNRFGADPLARA